MNPPIDSDGFDSDIRRKVEGRSPIGTLPKIAGLTVRTRIDDELTT